MVRLLRGGICFDFFFCLDKIFFIALPPFPPRYLTFIPCVPPMGRIERTVLAMNIKFGRGWASLLGHLCYRLLTNLEINSLWNSNPELDRRNYTLFFTFRVNKM